MNLDYEVINYFPGLVLAKDLELKFLNISNAMLALLGWHNIDQAIAKTDYDMPCPAGEFAAQFVALDKKVLESGKRLTTLQVHNYSSGWKIFLLQRDPIKNDRGEVTGIFDQIVDVTDVGLFKRCLLLSHVNQKIANVVNKSAIYVLDSASSPLPITQQQEICLFLLIRGKTTKQIAGILSLSVRTIEAHVESMRNKLGCYSKAQLIERAIDSGFFYYIPKEMLKYKGVLPHSTNI